MMTLTEAVEEVRHNRRSIKVKCPAHDDGTASLNVSPGDDQPVVLFCHAGCKTSDIVSAADIDWDEVCRPPEPSSNVVQMETVYSYTDESGTELFQAVRRGSGSGKQFFQRHHDHGTVVNNLQGVRRVLYRLPQVLAAIENQQTIVVVEGEKDVHTAETLGQPATTAPMGAGKWRDEYTETLAGASIYVIADRDDAGWKHARDVQARLVAAGCSVKVWESDRANDLTDHVQAGGTLADLVDITSGERENGQDFYTYITREYAEEEFIIPGCLARGDRCIVTGWEGHGKSMMLRQIAVMSTVGIHPFQHTEMQPVRVLYIDAENREQRVQRSWRYLTGLARKHGHPLAAGMSWIEFYPRRTPDLATSEGREWLLTMVDKRKPDLICCGPIRRLTMAKITLEETANFFCNTIDLALGVCGSAIVMEGHAPWEKQDNQRVLRPYGHSSFTSWADFCFGLLPMDDYYEFTRERGPRDADCVGWPDGIRRGTPNTFEWPWEPTLPEAEVRNLR